MNSDTPVAVDNVLHRVHYRYIQTRLELFFCSWSIDAIENPSLETIPEDILFNNPFAFVREYHENITVSLLRVFSRDAKKINP